ncbi:Hpt domain-containing protein [Acidihalobacter ferrooxydans]|uniref:Chemotaxis protein CheA n=1 Tax=Acidihalobacter ferrooxydans TaxID=1765967 RepID=A0A1P8UK66_9GAMM|nr:Hpt domain-containing protein [Acidihalobacter ferrooxydans]APZ44215.1 hypothetical protein BW247_14890 [Acidihalobacter ferrooxydans]
MHDANAEYDALAWVKPELDALLDRARQSLEAYVEEQSRHDLLAAVAQVLRQVRGTLQVVDLAGAVMLAEEMELLADELVAERIKSRDDALGVLSTAVLQLPDYLEYIQSGHPDTPIVILPLLNDLRAARDAELLSEKLVFVPDLDVEDEAPIGAGEADPLKVVKARRHSYQLGLLAVFRDRQQTATLERMMAVLGELEAASRQSVLRRLWWVGSALLETLGEASIPTAIKLLLGRLDRVMREILQRGEAVAAQELQPDLLKNLLYYVARAETVGPLARAVRETFHLEALLPDETGVEAARRELSAPNVKLLDTVGGAIREDLAEIRDRLEIYTHSHDAEAADFELIAARLTKVADTLSILGLSEAREQVAAQAEHIATLQDGGTRLDDDALLGLAEAMLQTESALQELLQRRRDGKGATSITGEMTAAGVSEALRELNRVKDALLAYFDNPGAQPDFAATPKILTDIVAALALIGVDPPVSRMRAIAEHIQAALGTDQPQTQAWKDGLAEAITAVEMYLESRTGQRHEQQAFLIHADEALARLGQGDAMDTRVDGAVDVPDHGADGAAEVRAENEKDSESESMTSVLPNESVSAPDGAGADYPVLETDDTVLRTWVDESGGIDVPRIDLQDEDVDDSDDTLLARAADADSLQAGLAAERASAPEETDPRYRLAALREDADPEILEIFLEEAHEEFDRIGELLPRWQADHSDDEALAALRRSFHTLKGSGRLAGAEAVGEFAWAFESMLNRIIEHAIEVRDEHFVLLAEARDALSELLAQLHDPTRPMSDWVALAQAAERASKDIPEGAAEEESGTQPASAGQEAEGDAESDASFDTQETVADTPIPDLESLDVSAPAYDDVVAEPPPASHIDLGLLEIFTQETREHLAVVDDAIMAMSGNSAPTPISEAFVIALHTLNGSSRTADIPSLSAVFGPLETIAVRLRQAGRPLPHTQLDIFQDAVSVTEATLARLPDAEAELPDTQDLARRAQDVLSTLDLMVAAQTDTDEQEEGMAVDDALWTNDLSGLVAEPAEPAEFAPEDEAAPPLNELPESTHVPEIRSESSDSVSGAVLEEGAGDAGKPDLPDDLDAELVSIFLDEGDELMASADAAIQAWQNGPGDALDAIETLQRDLHTLKGGARMAGFATIGDLTHGLESLIARLVEQGTEPRPDGFALLHEAVDQLSDMLQLARQQRPVYPQAQLIARMVDYAANTSALHVTEAAADVEPADGVAGADSVAVEASGTVTQTTDSSAQADVDLAGNGVPQDDGPDASGNGIDASTEDVASVSEDAPAFNPQRAATTVQSNSVHGGEQVRVRAELLDSLVNYAGEVNIYHARLQQQIGGFGYNLRELRQTVGRVREQLRKLELETEAQVLFRFQLETGADGAEQVETQARAEFDPLELDRYSNIQQLSRALAESLSDLSSIEELLAEEVRDAETLLQQQQRVSTDLQDGLMRSRMVQFGGLAPRLRRIVRQTAAELDKQAELQLSGEHSEVDRSVLDRLIAPLEHMLRNAVAHGLENADERIAAGKSEVGKISVSVSREGSEVVVEVKDDGRGVNVAAVREKAIRAGLIAPDTQLDDRHVVQLILESGFSTADEVSQISGRGVGMDVVLREVKQLGGVLSIDSERGRGTRFVVRLPFTLTITQALLAQVGEHLYALPLSGVEGVVRMQAEELRLIYGEESARYDYFGAAYAVKPLEAVLGGKPSSRLDTEGGYFPLLLVRSGESRLAVQVDSLIGSREVVVKTLGTQFARLRGVAGATILGDGRVVLILDTADLARMSATLDMTPALPTQVEASEEAAPHQPLIMVVDDSITIRKVTSRVLERSGFDVVTARDGMDAIAQLEECKPDLLLTDIEMPRMDGYELSSRVRNDTRFAEIPIIMITSRSGEKHRLRAQEIGVDRYLGKPYQEADLLDNIRELLRAARNA